MTTDSTSPADRVEPTSEADRPSEAPTTVLRRRRWRGPVRLGLLLATLFAVLAMFAGGTGLVLGKIASFGGEHRHHEYSFYEEHGHRVPGPFQDGN